MGVPVRVPVAEGGSGTVVGVTSGSGSSSPAGGSMVVGGAGGGQQSSTSLSAGGGGRIRWIRRAQACRARHDKLAAFRSRSHLDWWAKAARGSALHRLAHRCSASRCCSSHCLRSSKRC